MNTCFGARSLALLASAILLPMCSNKSENEAPPAGVGSGGVLATSGTVASGGRTATASPSSTSSGGSDQSGAGGKRDTSVLPTGGNANGGSNPGSSLAGGASNGGASSGGASTDGTSTRARGGAGSGGVAASGGRATNTGGGKAGMSASTGASITGGSNGKAGAAGATATGTVATGGVSGNSSRPTVVAASGTKLVKINARTKYQTFEGWGTSLAWWAYQIGGWSSAKREQFLNLIVDPVAGLGYNVFRYNIGGGDAPSHNHMGANREMPGFQASDGSWDWNADARQTAVLTQLVSAGKNVIIEGFSNSPPYWMTKSGCASGNSDGSNNLKDDSYNAFADYLTAVTKHYHDELGITFRTLEPMNEPNANWWKAEGGQEGCHFAAANQQQIIKAVSSALTAKGLTETKLSASDENSMDDAYSILGGYDAASMAAIAQMNVHSYAGSKRTQLHTLASSKNKRLWQSESGPLSVDLASNTDSAIFMAGRIIQDLRELQPEAWIEWQVVDPAPNWTSFTVNDAQQTFTPVKRFYMQSGFTRYIRPGATFIDIDNADMVAALSADGSQLTIVVRNADTAASKGFTFDLTTLASVGANVEIFRTSASENLVQLAAVPVSNWSFSATVPAYSVTTYVITL